ncbi:hypothetical protein NKI19_11095 [Mesorhizobium sp. M0751]|uniref:hypothetical protein n=1 Tax=unclassified Mesorhizobium TaxID=325217 RepID=UPI00333C366B
MMDLKFLPFDGVSAAAHGRKAASHRYRVRFVTPFLALRDNWVIQRAVEAKRHITTDAKSVKEVRNFVGVGLRE